MTTRFGDGNLTPVLDSKTGSVRRRVCVDIGGTGAPTVSGGDTNIGITRSTTGTYSITFPPCADRTLTAPILDAGIQVSAAPTVAACRISAIDFSAGTATLITFLATPGTPVDPANGDKLWIEMVAGGMGVR